MKKATFIDQEDGKWENGTMEMGMRRGCKRKYIYFVAMLKQKKGISTDSFHHQEKKTKKNIKERKKRYFKNEAQRGEVGFPKPKKVSYIWAPWVQIGAMSYLI